MSLLFVAIQQWFWLLKREPFGLPSTTVANIINCILVGGFKDFEAENIFIWIILSFFYSLGILICKGWFLPQRERDPSRLLTMPIDKFRELWVSVYFYIINLD